MKINAGVKIARGVGAGAGVRIGRGVGAGAGVRIGRRKMKIGVNAS